jgi:Ohr subfamily peroxiredoxin
MTAGVVNPLLAEALEAHGGIERWRDLSQALHARYDRAGTNPEQLFAAGWSACFEGAMGLAARSMQVALPADAAIDAEVDLGMTGDAYLLQARLNVSLPGLEREVAQAVIDRAHQTCPYSKATRGNIDVTINLV